MEDDKQDEELPPFQWNRQAKFMATFFAIALIVPLFGVFFLLRGVLAPHAPVAPPAQAVDTKPLQRGLEKMSVEKLSSTTQLAGSDTVEIETAAANMGPRIERIAQIAKTAGGSALEMTEAGAMPRRVVVNVPETRADLFKRAIVGDPVDFSAIPAGAETAIVEVILKAP